MDLELRHLRCLVAIADTGTFTDAGIELGISQAAVSRNLLALENLLGARLLHRTSRSVTPTTAGVHVLAQARQILAAAANLVSEATTGHTALRIGHAWSAMGRYTREFQRRWAAGHPETELQLIRVNSPTGGLAEGLCDAAVLRAAPAGDRFDGAVVGWERRYLAVAADDPWARRRSFGLAEVARRTVVIDRRTGTTTPDLWQAGARPELRDTRDIDDWLAIIAAGGGVASRRRAPPASTGAMAWCSGRCATHRRSPSTSCGAGPPASRDVCRRRPAHRALPGEPGVTTGRTSGERRAKARRRSG